MENGGNKQLNILSMYKHTCIDERLHAEISNSISSIKKWMVRGRCSCKIIIMSGLRHQQVASVARVDLHGTMRACSLLVMIEGPHSIAAVPDLTLTIGLPILRFEIGGRGGRQQAGLLACFFF
jgi:hypothetical protein